MLFRKTKPVPAPPDRGPARDPFEAVPHVAPEVTVETDSAGAVHVERRIIPKSRVMKTIERKFGWRRSVLVNLDDHGSFFWKQIDGSRDLNGIAVRIQEETGVTEDESRRATLLFTRDLMSRGLIQLELPALASNGGAL